MSDQVPYPFAGWLEEHPDGGFRLWHEGGDHSPMLRSYEELHAYFMRVHRGELPKVEHVDRVRHYRNLDGLSEEEREEAMTDIIGKVLDKSHPPEDEQPEPGR